jgi:hypothetical protein
VIFSSLTVCVAQKVFVYGCDAGYLGRWRCLCCQGLWAFFRLGLSAREFLSALKGAQLVIPTRSLPSNPWRGSTEEKKARPNKFVVPALCGSRPLQTLRRPRRNFLSLSLCLFIVGLAPK